MKDNIKSKIKFGKLGSDLLEDIDDNISKSNSTKTGLAKSNSSLDIKIKDPINTNEIKKVKLFEKSNKINDSSNMNENKINVKNNGLDINED